MRIVVFVGLPGSGKSEAAAVAEELGIPVVKMGDVIRQACRERGLDPATHHGQIAKALREEDGPAAVADRSLPRVKAAAGDNETVVIDGVRSEIELERFREAFGEDLDLVRITAPDDARVERLNLRGRDAGAEDGGESLAERDERELGFGMGQVLERAERTIENDDSLARFHEKVRDLLTNDSHQ